MTRFDTREEMVAAVARATEAARLYYSSDKTLMSDAEYDALVDSIEESQEDFPNVDGVDALLNQVAAGQANGGDVPHSVPMLSLKKVKEPIDLVRFNERVEEAGSTVLVELKLDGSALAVRYVDGKLTQAITRGNGSEGKDVTSRVQNVVGLPSTLSVPLTGEVRGEVYMTPTQFAAASAARVAYAEAEFAARKNKNDGRTFDPTKFVYSHSRNATSGLINRDDAPGYEYQLSFAAYDIDFAATVEGYEGLVSDSYAERVADAGKLGITAALSLIEAEGNTLVEQIDDIGRKRAVIDIPTDGCVIKTDSYRVRNLLGIGSRHPNHSIAYKYESVTGQSVVRDIEVAVGRTGRISLRARIDPVDVDGSVITYASLHNPSWLANKDVRIGSDVTVKRANDIIPQIVDVLSHPAGSVPYEVPQTCPQCDGEWNKDSLLWRCESPECGILNALVYAASRDAWDIDDLSIATVTALVEAEMVEDVADIFTLTVDDLAALPMGRKTVDGQDIILGVKKATAIVKEIEEAKAKPFARILTGLGLRATGRGISRRLAARYVTAEALLAASADDLAQTEAVGRIKAGVIHSELRRMEPVIRKMAGLGVNLGQQEQAEAEAAAAAGEVGGQERVLEGKNVCVTGSMKGSALDGLSRTETQELIEEFGGRAASSVSKSTHILVCEAGSTSSKMKKAQSLGTVEILTPDEFASLLGK